ncbi:MAG: phosphotransferase [Wenzhouxiangellaceae bacterium]|nr:phosphotransferase [Wenzhouxiangellaceae bacterium]
MSETEQGDDARFHALIEWAADALGEAPDDVEPASPDASFRRYFRARLGDGTRILVDAPPEREDSSRFVDIAGRLAAAGLNVPDVLAADLDRGFMLLTDLGTRPYFRVLDDDNADALFGDAIDALVRMQAKASTDGLPDYDAALLLRELELFPDWFLRRHWQVEPTESELDEWEIVCMTLLRWALDQPKTFCHRDYMPRNLMVCEPNPGVLDFQDAVAGPVAYDPVCLFRDAFISWPHSRVEDWLEAYRTRAMTAGVEVPDSPSMWRRSCDLVGAQRHLKVLGIFARIRYRDGKPHYLEDAPRFFAYLRGTIDRNPELAPLGRLLVRWGERARPIGD